MQRYEEFLIGEKKLQKKFGGDAVGVEEPLGGGAEKLLISIAFGGYPAAGDISLHHTDQAGSVLFFHRRKGQAAGGAEGSHEEFVVGVGGGEGFFGEVGSGIISIAGQS